MSASISGVRRKAARAGLVFLCRANAWTIFAVALVIVVMALLGRGAPSIADGCEVAALLAGLAGLFAAAGWLFGRHISDRSWAGLMKLTREEAIARNEERACIYLPVGAGGGLAAGVAAVLGAVGGFMLHRHNRPFEAGWEHVPCALFVGGLAFGLACSVWRRAFRRRRHGL